ncbi:MAG: alkaline phosphatase family protein, partial [Chlorobium sp.]
MMRKNLFRVKWQLPLMIAIILLSAWSDSVGTRKKRDASLRKIETIVVIYAENRSFDNLYGLYPGANGILKNANGEPRDGNDFKQVDRDGITPFAKLPPVWNFPPTSGHNAVSFINELPNKPFRIDAQPGVVPGGILPDKATPDLVHRFYNNQMQIHD